MQNLYDFSGKFVNNSSSVFREFREVLPLTRECHADTGNRELGYRNPSAELVQRARPKRFLLFVSYLSQAF